MTDDLIRYDVLAQEALRGVLRKVMVEVAQTGLPGDHHFFITFDTNYPGVRISSRLAAQHPDEMTVVMQHQFWVRETAEDASWVMLETKWKLAPAIFTLESAANGMSLEANITLDGNCKVRFYDVLEGVAVMLRDCQGQLDKAYERINP